MFRRADAIETWLGDAGEAPAAMGRQAINPMTARLESPSATLGPRLGAQTWTATLHELAPDEATAAYHYGTPTARPG